MEVWKETPYLYSPLPLYNTINFHLIASFSISMGAHFLVSHV